MQMQMAHGLTALISLVDDEAVTLFRQPQIRGNLHRGGEQAIGEVRIGALQLGQTAHVPAGDDQDMGGSLGVDIPEGEEILIGKDVLAWYISGGNFAEQAIVHGVLSRLGAAGASVHKDV